MPLIYPLKQVLEVKKKRVEEAEKVVKEKREALEKEQEKLKQREEERDKVKAHHQAKLTQLREELDRGTTTDKIQQMKAYIKVVKENLKNEEKKVKEQQEQVVLAEKNLQMAIHELVMKRLEVDKIELHKKDWFKEQNRELEIKEENEFNEQGSVIYSMKQKEKKKYGQS
jgi:flagellar biosynthesis chaperone FliJ